MITIVVTRAASDPAGMPEEMCAVGVGMSLASDHGVCSSYIHGGLVWENILNRISEK